MVSIPKLQGRVADLSRKQTRLFGKLQETDITI